ncbi:TPA: hypothetical protein ACGV2A_000067 [Enterococcus faecium]|uniref:Uncharacterized protein n=1 Tax=Enterococcus faecalis (strain ATCC 700802 / V583) TaxID=226185 RepID=Q832A9_ENTFA|nr:MULTISPECIES: hypothetical protein [Enterococcus]AAO82056.1 hypothetical protein EF_2331 [Enterococcus faecalis V583]EEU68018.1 conserved hypothetical protein [Enterococcus faecalis Merz96]KGQ72297.1 hypothetical protein NZ06_13930 [Enterococcus faecalis]MCL6763511.1 hypothetical protein [Enterococcus faecalis]MCZ2001150.1 hypothetical protein [Enterococcus faecium]
MRTIEFQAKQLLMEKLDKNLLDHAKSLTDGNGPQIVDVYGLQQLAEVHCYLKTTHQFDPAEVEALLQFADPLEAACHCWEMNTHEYSFPICDLLRETRARELFELAKPEPPAKLSVREQLRAAVKEARQNLAPEERTKGGEAR